jgi:HD-GYP domain-containing protein (c-di-GMP phosphodiesterase class II)
VQKLREDKTTESIPCMLIVEGGETPDRLIGHETYVNDYIQKPFSVPEFESRVIGLLNLARQRETTVREQEPVVESLRKVVQEAEALASRTQESSEEEVPEALAHSLDRMRKLMSEFTECLSQVERRLRLSAALADSDLPDFEVERKVAAARGTECGSLLDFQSQRGRPAPCKEVADRSDPAAAPAQEEEDQGIEPDHTRALKALEQYRSEFRRLEKRQAEPERVPASGRSGEKSEPVGCGEASKSLPSPPPVWAQDTVDEVPVAEPETPLEFDSELLTRLGVDLAEPAGNKIKDEEFTSFARQSFLSAFLDEPEHVGRFNSLYEEAQDFVLRSIRRAAVGGVPYVARAEALVDRLIEVVGVSDPLILQATDRERSFTVSSHSVNVAALAIRVAQVRQRSREFQQRVGLAALFHEIGVVKLPEKLVFKETPLTDAELKTLRKRPLFSARVLQEEFGVVSEIVGQVFERENGLGYPLGLKSEQIRPEARLIGVVDFFEACIHPRPYRDPMTGYQALYELSRDGEFDQSVVRALARTVSLFPFNEILLLSSGEVVRVVGIHPNNLSRPVVQVELRKDGTEEREDRRLDLSRPGSSRIIEVLTHEKLAARRRRT